MKTVSLKRIIGNVIGDMGITNVNNIVDDMARWATDAQLAIGSRLSYKHIECEIKVKNNRAPLPDGIVRLNKLKIGNEYIEVTNKTFHQFFKGEANAGKILEEINLNQNYSDPKTGSPENCFVDGVPVVIRVHFSGVFVPGEVITLTFVYTNCGSNSTNSFTYVVQIGDTIPTIMQELVDQINAVQNIGFRAVVSNDYISIEGDNPDVNIQLTEYTNSIQGRLQQTLFQKRIPSSTTKDNKAHGKQNPMATSPNLANRFGNKLNDGMLRTSGYNRNDSQFDITSVAKFAISNSCIHVSNSNIERVGISYEGIHLDCDGFPMINEIHERATTAYLIHKYLQKRYWQGKVAQHVYKESQMEWFRLCSQARGDAELPNLAEMEYLANMWNQMIPLANKEFF